MDLAFGVEANPLIFEIPEFEQLISSHSMILEVYNNTYIFSDEKEAILAKELLEEADMFEEMHHLCVLDCGKAGECFYDYGFEGSSRVYLYKEFLCAASLDGHDYDQRKMAKIQLEEHLVYTSTQESQEVFFFDKQLDSLIKGICHAYKCEAIFLDLDKWKKKL